MFSLSCSRKLRGDDGQRGVGGVSKGGWASKGSQGWWWRVRGTWWWRVHTRFVRGDRELVGHIKGLVAMRPREESDTRESK